MKWVEKLDAVHFAVHIKIGEEHWIGDGCWPKPRQDWEWDVLHKVVCQCVQDHVRILSGRLPYTLVKVEGENVEFVGQLAKDWRLVFSKVPMDDVHMMVFRPAEEIRWELNGGLPNG